MKNVDLHTHSYYSDGEYSPKELVRLAKKKGVKYLALTDHNSVSGVKEAIGEGNKIGVVVIPGVELVVKEGEILAYFVDYKSTGLKKELQRGAYYEDEKTKRRINLLQKKGWDVSYDRFVKRFPYSTGNHNKGHLIYYLIDLGCSKEETKRILKEIKIKKPKKGNITLVEGIKLIKRYGGIPVLAHPWINKQKFTEPNLKKWAKVGLKGIEIENGEKYNFGRTKEFVKTIIKLAEKYNLILTSGSDFHGKKMSDLIGTHQLGKFNCDEKIVVKMKRLLKR